MPEYLAPGVYVEEIATGPVPIAGVSTSTSGMVGLTERGPREVQLVTSWLEFERWYGRHIDPAVSYLPYAVQGFFANLGQRLFVSRITRADAATATFDFGTAGVPDLHLEAIGPGEFGNRIFVRVQGATRGGGFRITILYYREAPPLPLVDPTNPANLTNANRREPTVVEDYDQLGFEPTGPNYVLSTINAQSKLVHADWVGVDAANPPARPNDVLAFGAQLGGGGDGAAALTPADYNGDPTQPTNSRSGLAALEAIDEIAILCVPDEVHPVHNVQDPVRNELINQCERLKDRFAVLQVPAGIGNVNDAQFTQIRDTSYAGIYYPWIRVFDPRTLDAILVPPGGHVVGIYARTDTERGVHKAPANAEVRGIMTRDLSGNRWPVEFKVTKGQHDILNPRGINVIRDFRADRRSIRVWGARTMSSDTQWKYVNVRRLFIFVEESIDEGTQWVVFEPNYEETWARVRRSVSNFLTRVWRDGALFGTTPEEAFFVRCDLTSMTQDDIDNGRLIAYVGIAPVKPAEFVIFRLSQKTLEATS